RPARARGRRGRPVAAEPRARTPPDARRVRHGPASARRRRILVVEDDAIISTAIAAYLRAAGYEVDAVDDGLKALRRIRYASPDAIVLDLKQTVSDGCPQRQSV